jgi:hypothetical protein
MHLSLRVASGCIHVDQNGAYKSIDSLQDNAMDILVEHIKFEQEPFCQCFVYRVQKDDKMKSFPQTKFETFSHHPVALSS